MTNKDLVAVNAISITHSEKLLNSPTVNWLAFDEVTGEEITVIYNVISKCVVSAIDSKGSIYDCNRDRLTSLNPFEFTPDNDCASDWEKDYLSNYTDFHFQVVGPTGPAGIVGDQGPTGQIGPIGLTGARGIVGDVGPVGPDGNDGSNGAKGQSGADGECLCNDFDINTGGGTTTGSNPNINYCPATIVPAGFSTGGTYPAGTLALEPGGSGTLRVEWSGCKRGAAITVRWGRVNGVPGCSAQASFFSGSPGNYYGNVNQSSGARIINVSNNSNSTCAITNPVVEVFWFN